VEQSLRPCVKSLVAFYAALEALLNPNRRTLGSALS